MLLQAIGQTALLIGALSGGALRPPAFFVRVEIEALASQSVAFRAISPHSAFRELDLIRMNSDAGDTGIAGSRPITTHFLAHRPAPDTVRATTPIAYLVDMLAGPVHFVVSGSDSVHITVRREPGGAVAASAWGGALTLERDGYAVALHSRNP